MAEDVRSDQERCGTPSERRSAHTRATAVQHTELVRVSWTLASHRPPRSGSVVSSSGPASYRSATSDRPDTRSKPPADSLELALLALRCFARLLQAKRRSSAASGGRWLRFL